MEIEKKDLLDALEIVKPGLASKDVIEQATSFAFIGDRVVTYNDEVSISHPIKGLQVHGAIKADKLYGYLSKVKKDKIDVEINKNEIIFSSGRSKAGLTIEANIKLPIEEIKEIGKWKDLPYNFTPALKFSMASCSKDMSRPVLTAVNITKDGFLMASDNLRIVQYELKDESKEHIDMPVKTFLLPLSSAIIVTRIGVTKIAEGVGWIHFSNEDDTIVSCRILEESFPDITPFLVCKGETIILPRTIKDAMERANVFSPGDHAVEKYVDITLHNEKIKIEVQSEEGWFSELLNVDYSGEKIAFGIVTYLLKDILSETSQCIIGKNKLKFQGEDWTYVTLLKA